MRIIRDYQFVEMADKGASVAIGNFDGVHLGHQSVINIAREKAAEIEAPLGVVTFEPHPRNYFNPGKPTFRLMSADARATHLRKLGIDLLYQLNFNSALSELSPKDFVQNVLYTGLDIKHVVVGADFKFGNNRRGTVDDLINFGKKFDISVTISPLITANLGEVSSTSIRKSLSDGRPNDAALQLGHWHRIEGTVVAGEQRGRKIGYPTTNMALDGLQLPKLGVYAVLVDVLEGPYIGNYRGVASLGVRPMFGTNSPNLETYIFDFSGDLYGKKLSIGLVEFLRPEEKYEGIDQLKVQIKKDCQKALSILEGI